MLPVACTELLVEGFEYDVSVHGLHVSDECHLLAVFLATVATGQQLALQVNQPYVPLHVT